MNLQTDLYLAPCPLHDLFFNGSCKRKKRTVWFTVANPQMQSRVGDFVVGSGLFGVLVINIWFCSEFGAYLSCDVEFNFRVWEV